MVDVDRQPLWREATQVHHGEPDVCAWCGRERPCAPRRRAELAADVADHPWNEPWTARDEHGGTPRPRCGGNRGTFL